MNYYLNGAIDGPHQFWVLRRQPVAKFAMRHGGGRIEGRNWPKPGQLNVQNEWARRRGAKGEGNKLRADQGPAKIGAHFDEGERPTESGSFGLGEIKRFIGVDYQVLCASLIKMVSGMEMSGLKNEMKNMVLLMRLWA